LAQEFVIKSPDIEDKINQLLPSQGGFQAGVDFSASTMVVPIVDLTETAQGSTLPIQLQFALSLNSITSFSIVNTTSTLVNTTGFFRVYGIANIDAGGQNAIFQLTDGTTTKSIVNYESKGSEQQTTPYDFIVFIKAGDSLQAYTDGTSALLRGNTRQIADVNGNLVDPT